MKKFFGIFLLLCSVAVFAVPELRAVPAKDTLVFWAMDDGVNSGFALQKVVRKFTRQTKIPVKVRFLNWGSAFEELKQTLSMDSASAAGLNTDVPDIIQLGSSWVPYFAKVGLISSIDTLLDVADTTRFYSEAMKSSHVGSSKELYALPWFLDVRGLFVNERLWLSMGFNESDVENYPAFFGTLRSIAKSELLNESGVKVAPFEFGVLDDWTGQQQMAPFLWSFGGDFVENCSMSTKECYRSALVDSNTLEGLRHYFNILRDLELSPYGLHENSSQGADRFTRSEIMMLFSTSEIIRKIQFGNDMGGLMESALAKDGIAVVPAPKGPAGRFTFVGGSHLALPEIGNLSKPEKRKAAIDLFLFMLRADNVDFYSRQIGFLPADKGLIRLWEKDKRFYRLIDELENDGRSFLNIPEWSQVEVVINGMVNRIGKVLREKNPEPSDEIARLVIDAHNKINEVLNYDDPADSDSLWACVKLAMMQPLDETKSDFREVDEKSNFILYVITSAAVLVIFVIALVLVFRRKR